jgi:hypothetical protein
MTLPASSGARSDLHGAAGWMALGLAVLVGAWHMDRFEAMGATVHTAPGLVPGLFGLALLVLGAALAWRSRRAAPGDVAPPLLNARVAWVLLLTLVYALAGVGRLPFGPVTALFVAVFCWLFNDEAPAWRRLWLAALTGVVTAVAVVLVFERLFYVRLP